MSKRREAGNSVVTLLLLLAILGGAGAWNYRKNVEAEEDVHRPFKGYTDDAIADLRGAYETRQEGDQERYERIASRRVEAEGQGYFDQQVAEFERVQKSHAGKKVVGERMAESRTTLKLLKDEQRLRASERDRMKLFFRRLLTIRS